MELRGQLKSWNDQKGFGFIRSEQNGDDVFAHISAMRGARRPVQGDRVLYLSEPDKDGRLRATHVRLDAGLSIDEPKIRHKPSNAIVKAKASDRPHNRPNRSARVSQPLPKVVAYSSLLVLPTSGLMRLGGQGIHWPLYAYFLASLLALGLYLHDKRRAQHSGWRTPEAQLHLIELLGGWPGALIAQQTLRHKTRKIAFQIIFWLIVMAHQIAWLDYLYLQRLRHLVLQLAS
ncbi:DUF1294 domain-containing protein [Stutzerimonas zhaodongensis]|uniref:DUF1294 domain-containing protein n=1 Tax=Stutzerimonas zhaodongensis TaxID=1176257 RepID=A0A3M2HHG4_9GAMM|nr:DUF1294 domain-containing protein [Stutzerimonas zhaodongensis]MCQ4317349.1 DUF1294 domain-containing protein [Stutzerimonas zhaodongensis]RMH88418.1 DUF1294 domain-containing protein [Stutzerimonas zhaodongensis]